MNMCESRPYSYFMRVCSFPRLERSAMQTIFGKICLHDLKKNIGKKKVIDISSKYKMNCFDFSHVSL